MAKNIIFCADGTWNGPGKDEDGDSVPARPMSINYSWDLPACRGRIRCAMPTNRKKSSKKVAR